MRRYIWVLLKMNGTMAKHDNNVNGIKLPRCTFDGQVDLPRVVGLTMSLPCITVRIHPQGDQTYSPVLTWAGGALAFALIPH